MARIRPRAQIKKKGKIMKKKYIPAPPKGPCCRLITEGSTTFCVVCGSSIKKKFWSRKIIGCIQPECKRYYLREK